MGCKSCQKAKDRDLKGSRLFADNASERMKICQSCEHYKKNFCGICHCYLAFKTRLKMFHCPIEKW